MKKYILFLLLLLFTLRTVEAQGPVPGQTVNSFDGTFLYYTDVSGVNHRMAIVPQHGKGAPTNPCVNSTSYADDNTNNYYACINNVWVQINGGSNPVSFNPHTFQGNNTGSSAFPSPSLIGSSDVTPDFYAVDTGLVNAYVVNPTPAITSLVGGVVVGFTTTNPNTGASTVNVSSLGTINLTKNGGSSLNAGDIKANTFYLIEYNTSLASPSWELVGSIGSILSSSALNIADFGARASNPNTTPAAIGLTANCNSVTNPTQVTISSASTFVNGDGVILYGCGTPHSMTTPVISSVTPSVDIAGTATLQSVPGPTGSTTYNYKMIARDRNGGLTAASTVVSTTTGAVTLGTGISVNITSMTRSNQTVTAVTALAHGFLVGCSVTTCGEVFIGGGNGLTDTTFRGWYSVTSAADSTHFTFVSGPDTRNGATSSSIGGTATWFNHNLVCASAMPTGAVELYLLSDRANPGTYAVIAAGYPNSTGGVQDLCIQDYGSPMMDNQAFPPFITAAAPWSAATSDHLSTTISSGAGTTTLTLANAAGTTISGATIRLDAVPGILAAQTQARSTGGTVLIPVAAQPFVVNSWLNMGSGGVSFAQTGNLYLNDTFEFPGNNVGTQYKGSILPQPCGALAPGAWGCFVTVSINTAHPGFWLSNNTQFGMQVSGLNLSAIPVNGTVEMIVEGGFNQLFDHITFGSGSGVNDYISMGLMLKGAALSQANSNVRLDFVTFIPGGGGDAASHTPTLWGRGNGNVLIPHSYSLHRGMVFTTVSNIGIGPYLGVGGIAYMNGGGTPLLTVSPSNSGGGAVIGPVVMDTAAQPCVTSLQNTGGFGTAVAFTNGSCIPSSGVLGVSGLYTSLQGITSPTYSSFANSTGFLSAAITDAIQGFVSNYPQSIFNGQVAIAKNYGLFIEGDAPVITSCPVSAGGSLSVGAHTFQLVPLWWNGNQGRFSTICTATTTSGNQTVTLNYNSFAGNPQVLRIYDSNGSQRLTNITASPSATSVVVSSETTIGGTGDAFPTGGPTMLLPGTQGMVAPNFFSPQYQTSNNGFTVTETTSLTANRNVTKPDASGTGMIYTGTFNNNECVQAHVAGGITTFVTLGLACGSGGGGGPTIQTNGTNNTSQTTLNFITSSVNSMGITMTPTNPSTGNEKLEASGTVNASSGGTGLNSPTAHSLLVTEGSSPFNLLTSPSTNGFYNCGFNVTASAGVDPICQLPGVNIVKPSTPYTMIYSDRFTYQFLAGGTTFTINLPQIIGNTASNFGFVTQNQNTGNLTETANAADDIDGSALGGSQTILPNFAAFNYSESAINPGHWRTIKFPTFGAFPACTNALQFSTTTGFSCSGSFGTVTSVGLTQTGSIFSITGSPITTSGNINLAFVSFGAHQWFGNNTASSAAPTAQSIGSSDVTTNLYAADTGAVNAYVIAPSPAVTALTAGTIVTFTTANQNTGASTINVNSLGVKNITKAGGTALSSGDIKANAPIMIEYNTAIGTPGWELVSGAGASGSGTVTSVDGSAGNGVQTIQSGSVTAITAAGTVQSSDLVNSQTGTTYTIATGDRGHVIVQSNAAAIADTLPQATSGAASNFAPGWFCEVFNTGTTNVTVTPTTSTINGKTNLVVPGGTWVKIISDGTNYDALVENGAPSKVNLTAVTAQAAVTTDQALQELSLPAGYLNVLNQPFWIHGSGIYTIAAAQTPTLQFKIKLCTVSGCGSGTAITLANITTSATLTLTNNNWNLGVLAFTNTTGTTGNFIVHGAPGLTVDLAAAASGADTVFGDTNTAVSSAIDLTTVLFVDFTVATSTGNAGNQITEQVEMVAPQSNPAGGGGISAPGSNGQILVNSNGSIAAIDLPQAPIVVDFANCVNGTAGAGPSYASSNFTAACRAGTNNLGGALQAIPSTGASLQFLLELPKDWDTSQQPFINVYYGSGSNTSGTVIWTVSSACVDVSTPGGASDDPAFHAESAFSTQTMANASRMWFIGGQFTAVTSGNGCKAQSPIIIKLALSGTASSNVNAYKAVLTIPRLPVVQAN